MTTVFEDDMKQFQAHLKALEAIRDPHAKAKLLEATYELRDKLNAKIQAIPEEYKQQRLQRQMQTVEQTLKRHADRLKA